MAKRRKKATRKTTTKRRKKRATAAPKRRRKSTRTVAPKRRKKRVTKRKRTRRSRKVRVTVGKRVAKHGVRSVRINRPRRRRRNSALMVAGSNPRRRSSRRYRRNPLRVAGFDFMRNMPIIFAGAASVIATTAIPDYLNMTGKGPLYKYGTQIGVVAGGGYLISNLLKKRSAGYAWMLAGSAVILADLLRQYVIGSWIPSLAGSSYTAFPSPYVPQAVTDYSESSDYGVGAFPSPYEGVGAYPGDTYGY